MLVHDKWSVTLSPLPPIEHIFLVLKLNTQEDNRACLSSHAVTVQMMNLKLNNIDWWDVEIGVFDVKYGNIT